MIGMVVVGHGQFASGLTSALDLIVGKPENYRYVDFLQTYSVNDLERELHQTIEQLSTLTNGIIIFTDLLGGRHLK